ncbi:hypothetical protein GCM10010218_45330 [Streptomyces mashuensis]|uniref:Uncharacterized protein n=1 Tax=Streptomyces mashuensis TaxID=33904 RepID=A0A919B6X7_9ACTN|nr:hypothetical protein GCM10010218_45330 [Streptomyces mashuensis]
MRSCAPWGPDKSILPLSGCAPSPGPLRVRPAPSAAPTAWEGSRYGPPPLCGGRSDRDGADTEVDAAYMGGTDPFVSANCSAPPSPGPWAPWGMLPGFRVTGVARSYITPDHGWQTTWRTLANPGEYSLGP